MLPTEPCTFSAVIGEVLGQDDKPETPEIMCNKKIQLSDIERLISLPTFYLRPIFMYFPNTHKIKSNKMFLKDVYL